MNVKTFLNNYVETVNRIRPKYMNSDCCIAIARINQIILEDYHFKVQPVTVQLEIFNEAFVKKGRPPKDEHETRAWADEGVWKIVLGWRQNKLAPGKWPGHLVSIVNNQHLLDITITQATRPHKNINLEPLVIATINFSKPLCIRDRDTYLFYDFFWNDKTYLNSPDWQKQHKDFVKEIRSCL
jgi:hypothetical protein